MWNVTQCGCKTENYWFVCVSVLWCQVGTPTELRLVSARSRQRVVSNGYVTGRWLINFLRLIEVIMHNTFSEITQVWYLLRWRSHKNDWLHAGLSEFYCRCWHRWFSASLPTCAWCVLEVIPRWRCSCPCPRHRGVWGRRNSSTHSWRRH